MNVVQTIITVKPDATLEKAIAAVVASDDDFLTEPYLQEMSVQYGPKTRKTTTVVENLLDEGQNSVESN